VSHGPLVSVCIPTYNYARLVGQAVESALAQTHPDVEVLLIDDASSDDTEEVAKRFAGHPRFAFHRNEQNLGLFGNFNRCFELARGDYVKVLCADDWLHPRSVEDAVAVLEAHPSVGMTTSPGWLVDIAGDPRGLLGTPFGGSSSVVPGGRALAAHADWGNAAGMPSHVLLRRSVIDEVGGFEAEFAPASDVHLWLKVLAHHDLGWVPEPRCWLRIHTEHTHRFGAGPSESVFRVWEDMARREPAVVDAALLDRALYGEARHHLLYAVAHLLGLRLREAARIARSAGEHVSWRTAVPRLAVDVPRLAWDQLSRMVAIATGRLVVYGPRPRAGASLASMRRPAG
jgi:glycosyltransferase involved in cell wall biosynthesis